METANNINQEKRKNVKNKVKNNTQICNNSKNVCDLSQNSIGLFAWVKTLISVHDYIPNIINLIDKVVAAKASSPIDGSAIFGDHKRGTYNQIEQVLNLQDRKVSLLNIYAMVENMVESLPKKYIDFVKLKFYKHKKTQYIAEELDIDERTAFRWSHIVLNKLVLYCEKNNWSEMFFAIQTQQEPWIKDRYQTYLKKLKTYNKV